MLLHSTVPSFCWNALCWAANARLVVNSTVRFLCNSQGSKTDVYLMSKWSRYTHMALKTTWATFTSSVGFDFVGRAPELDLMVKSIFVYLCLRLWTSWPLCRVGILSKINTKINHSVTGLKFSKFYFGKVKFFTPLEHEPPWSVWRTSAFCFSTRMWQF